MSRQSDAQRRKTRVKFPDVYGIVPESENTGTKFLRDDFTWQPLSGGSGSPGGSDTQVQFNDGGSFGGDAGMTYDKATNTMTVDKVKSDTLQAKGSGGVAIHNTSGAYCALFGVGGGQNVTFYDGVKLDAGTASAVTLTDSSKNISYLVLGAGQSIRRNAGDTAYEAYTPSSGLEQYQVRRIIRR